MPIALTPDETFEYQLKEDRATSGEVDPGKTIFILGALTPEDEAPIGDKFLEYDKGGQVTSIRWGTTGLIRLRKSLKGWRNFLDRSGQPVDFDRGNQDRNIARIPHRARGELIQAYRDHFRVSESEGN